MHELSNQSESNTIPLPLARKKVSLHEHAHIHYMHTHTHMQTCSRTHNMQSICMLCCGDIGAVLAVTGFIIWARLTTLRWLNTEVRTWPELILASAVPNFSSNLRIISPARLNPHKHNLVTVSNECDPWRRQERMPLTQTNKAFPNTLMWM